VPRSKAEQAVFVLNDAEILQLACWGCTIEEHYGCPMDMEWAKDGITGELFIIQGNRTISRIVTENDQHPYQILSR
jgi:pyruvate,water dikinase